MVWMDILVVNKDGWLKFQQEDVHSCTKKALIKNVNGFRVKPVESHKQTQNVKIIQWQST